VGLRTPRAAWTSPARGQPERAAASPWQHWFILGGQDPAPVFRLRGCSPWGGVRVVAVGELGSGLSPAARCPRPAGGCFGGRGAVGGGARAQRRGFGLCPAVIGVPMGPPSSAQRRVIGVGRDGAVAERPRRG